MDAFFVENPNEPSFAFIYSYREKKPHIAKGSPRSGEGTQELRIKENGNTLEGPFYSMKGRAGEVRLQREESKGNASKAAR